MASFSDLYFEQSSSESQYSRIPPGVLSVGRLINNKPYWRKNKPAQVLKRKTLILTDWTASSWSFEERECIKKKLTELIAEGFYILLWCNGFFEELSELNKLDDFIVLTQIKPALPEEIKKAAVTQKKAASVDELYLLDGYSLFLQEQTPSEPYSLSTHRLLGIATKDYPLIILLLQQQEPALTEIIHDVYSLKSNELLGMMHAHFPHLSVRTDYRYLELTSAFEATEGNLAKLTNIETVDIRELCKEELLERVFHAISSLKKLTVNDDLISSNVLNSLLCSASSLKVLELPLYQKIDEFDKSLFDLPVLESLDLGGSNTTIRNLMRFLICPKLKVLYLMNCENISDFYRIPFELPSLEILELQESVITFPQLKQFLLQANHLKKLNLSACFKLTFDELESSESLYHLSELESLELDSTFINGAQLQIFLHNAQKLKILQISSCQYIKKFNDTLFNLPMLQELDCSETMLSERELQKLLDGAKGLKTLNLRKAQNLGSMSNLVFSASLETLKIDQLNISQINFKKLLSTTPNLKTLSLHGCRGCNEIELMSLPLSLEKLVISRSDINETTLDNLVARIPTLKIIDIKKRVLIAQPTVPTTIFDAEHSSQEYFSTQPTDEQNFNFSFKNINHTLNQGMLIDKLSQYLTLKAKDTKLIAKMQDGICYTLARCFVEQKDNWQNFLRALRNWNGQLATISSELSDICEFIVDRVKRYQFSIAPKKIYLGDGCIEFLLANKEKTFILVNPWHAIAIHYSVSENLFKIYDSNFVTGVKSVSEQELSLHIKNSLGEGLVSIAGETIDFFPLIHEPNIFLRDGGFLVLSQSANAEQILQLLPNDPMSELSKEALDGLMIRNVQGVPAWMDGLKKPQLKVYFQSCLKAFASYGKDSYLESITRSLGALTPNDYTDLLASALELVEGKTLATPPIMPAFLSEQHYERALQTWKKGKEKPSSIRTYYLESLTPNHSKKRLIELMSSAAVESLQLGLLTHCMHVSRPVFCINSPDDLVCLAPFIEREGLIGKMKEGPGGPLYDFLMENKDTQNAPVLLVNYDRFGADDIVRCNALLDTLRKVDGVALPEQFMVVGLINTKKPDVYQGSDFYSRFGINSVERCPFTPQELDASLFSLPDNVRPEQLTEDTLIIDLGKASDWEERLLGRWIIKKQQLEWEEGELSKAFTLGKKIHIQNGLWDEPEFRSCWQQALIRGKFEKDGIVIPIPQEIQWTRAMGYDWQKLSSHLELDKVPQENALLLNPSKLGAFFVQYECNNSDKTLDSLPGIIAANKNKSIYVNLTRELTEGEWGLLLLECQKYQVTLHCTCLPGVFLPKVLTPQNIESSIEPFYGTKQIRLIVSNDVSTAVAEMSAPDSIAIDVSECDSTDLLEKLDGNFNRETACFEFEKKLGVIYQWLKDGKDIILYGTFSGELLDNLASLLSSPLESGSIKLITAQKNAFLGYAVETHHVSAEQKLNCLKRQWWCNKNEIDYFNTNVNVNEESYSRLCARLMLMRSKEVLTDKAWEGLSHLPPTPKLRSFNPDTSKEEADAFDRERLNSVNEILMYSPYVYLAGKTGVGKTTFIEQCLKSENTVIYRGETQMKEWALSSFDKETRQILFIDEANLSNRQWSEFEGLFNLPPAILIDGIYYPLSKAHQVVFAGNPISYGGERHLPSLFVNHGGSLVFEPMPLAYIFERILKPVFDDPILEKVSLAEVTQPILDVYRFICEHSSEDEVLISPRELQMMALLTLSYIRNNQPCDKETCIKAAHHYAYTLGRNLVPIFHKKFDDEFRQEALGLPQTFLPLAVDSSFSLPLSRQALVQQLEDFLLLQQTRRTIERPVKNKAHYFGGLGGIIIEGEPGIGKSELIIQRLRAHGYEEEHNYLSDKESALQKPFYRMPDSMSLDDKKKLLLKAFNEGAVVIIDEINSSPMLERLFNDLLMGKSPEGHPPKRLGFMLIGTQNPVTMAGRHKQSTALARRFVHVVLPSYSTAEMHHILMNKGLSEKDAKSLVAIYEKNLKKAIEEHLNPAPTFRDLCHLADNIIEGREQLKSYMDGRLIPYNRSHFFRLPTDTGEKFDAIKNPVNKINGP